MKAGGKESLLEEKHCGVLQDGSSIEEAGNATSQHQFLHRSLVGGFLLSLVFPPQLLQFLPYGIGLSLGIQKMLSRGGLLRLQLLQVPRALQPPFESQLSGWMTSSGGVRILVGQGGSILAAVGPSLHRSLDLG